MLRLKALKPQQFLEIRLRTREIFFESIVLSKLFIDSNFIQKMAIVFSMRNDVIKYFQGFLFILGKPGDSNIEFGQYIFPLDIFEAEPEISFAFSESFILGIYLRSIKKGKKQEENDGDKFVPHRSQNQIGQIGDKQSGDEIQESPGDKGESRS